MPPSITLGLFAALVCLLPLALYALTAAQRNRARPARVVPGAWDAAALVLGLSGFLAVGVPGTLGLMLNAGRGVTARVLDPLTAVTAEGAFGPVLGLVYYVLVVAAAGAWVWRQRRVVELYNVEVPGLTERLATAFRERGWDVRPTADGFAVRLTAGNAPVRFTVAGFPLACHATLRVSDATAGQRAALESAAADAAVAAAPDRNPAAVWFTSLATTLLIVMAFLIAAIILGIFRRPA